MEVNAGMGRRGLLGAAAAAVATVGLGCAPGKAARADLPAGKAGRASAAGPRPLHLGTYTSVDGGGKGVALATYQPTTGAITSTGVVTGVGDPSFLAIGPSGGTLYTVNERAQGAVTAIALNGGGTPKVLGSRPTGGAGPCHLSVHPGGRHLFSANYDSGSVAVHPIGADGRLGARTALVRHTSPPPGPGQDGPHAHQIITAPDGRFVLAVDLGNDTVYTYRLDDAAGTLHQVSFAALRPGAGPRSLTFHPGGRFAYLANELDNTVVVCGYDPSTGKLAPGAPQSTGTGNGTNYPAQLLVTADGAFAYLANRGHNSITRYAVESGGSALRLLDTVPVGGDFPRHIAFDPTGRLLFAANQRSATVTVLTVDSRSGKLAPAGRPFAAPGVVCVLPSP
ncbi:lactonase family protein [Streptomyces sp. H10-C2]|uniref:lactonase family protein n=1 Tax=unclassified Streptomyces TaxID=2593676 RepID=UPI0024BB9773|nr:MULTISPECIES: lactonase family protein [unclassified Streptomyces]MDJ0347465.1 lactonase family protein [Streptomyces sp. PH10-H1]MDJ0368847.1 lactonase family protein [Streptomyces sp. H10-C2]